jgi:hypothetical protein
VEDKSNGTSISENIVCSAKVQATKEEADRIAQQYREASTIYYHDTEGYCDDDSGAFILWLLLTFAALFSWSSLRTLCSNCCFQRGTSAPRAVDENALMATDSSQRQDETDNQPLPPQEHWISTYTSRIKKATVDVLRKITTPKPLTTSSTDSVHV